MRTHLYTSLATLATLAATSVAGAQQPNASPTATGLSGAYTARARGYDAVAWNPANLAMPGNPAFSLGLAAISAAPGLDPISLKDFAPYSGKDVPLSQRATWLQTVTSKGGENGRLDAGISYIGMSMGPLAFQVGSSLAGTTKLNPDAVQALLFGNAGLTGSPQALNLAGSNFHGGAFTTAAVSYGWTIVDDKRTHEHMALGITGKYVMGNAVAIAQDMGSTTGTNVTLNFPIVYSNPDSSFNAGNGYGMDLGFAWSQDKVSFGAAVQNVFNTFKWDTSKLYSRAGTGLFDGSSFTDNFTEQSYAASPAALQTLIANDKFKPVYALGLAYRFRESVILSADARQQTGDVLLVGPKTSVGGGIDYRWLPLLRLQGGASYITDGWGVSGGVGIQLGKYELGVGAALRSINGSQQPGVTLNVLSLR